MTPCNGRGDERPSLLLVDDDVTLCESLGRALAAQGFEVRTAHTLAAACALAEESPPEFAVVDLKLGEGSGLELVPELRRLDPHTRIVVLTAYGSIATAIDAIKLGATYFLTKPVNVNDIVKGFQHDAGDPASPPDLPMMSIDRLEWEYIDRALHEHKGNISATARALSMHRRTLQRKLAKRPAKR